MKVFGLQLGEKFSLSECAKDGMGYDLITNRLCFERYPTKENENTPIDNATVLIRFPLSAKPEMLKDTAVAATLIEGKLEGLSFNTFGVSTQDEDLDRLKTKYGEPGDTKPLKVQNRFGASFNSVIAIWTLANLHVSFASAVTTLDEGLVIVDTDKGSERRSKALKEAAKDKHPM